MSTAIAYVMNDFAGVRVPAESGGCGEEHQATADDTGYRRIECDRCAPYLVGSHYGYAATPSGVPLTPDEVADEELSARQAQAASNATDVEMRREWLRGRASQAPPLEDQLASMNAAQKARLLAMLNGDKPPARRGRPPKTTTSA